MCKISGITLPGAKIYAKIGNATYEGKAKSSGEFTLKTKKKLKKGTKVKMWAKSKSGIKGSVYTFKIN